MSEYPWEEYRVGGYNTIVDDEGTYKMWYHASSSDNTFLCYAASDDALHWKKPQLGLFEYRGSKQNNIVVFGTLQAYTTVVFIDPQASPAERYKCLFQKREEGRNLGEPWMLVSADGLRWRPLVERAVMEDRLFTDTQMVAFWDNRIGKYVAYGRYWYPEYLEGVRTVSRTETADLRRWPKPVLVFGRDDQDPENCHFYNSAATQYPHADRTYLMFSSAYYQIPKSNNNGPLDVQLVVSRDGIQWSRPERKPFLELGRNGTFDSGSIYVSPGMVRQGDELWIYYTGYDFMHADSDQKVDRKKGVISRAVLRLDGFVSVDAAYTGGQLTTVPFHFKGSRLELNVNTSAGGSVQVEILDGAGTSLTGFTRHDCDVIRVNSTAHTVTWKGSSDVSSLQEKVVKLRFQMRDSKLYAFQFRQ